MAQVSIIVPLFNKVHWVKRALKSVASQTFEDFEVIIVDDGSTDGGPAIAREEMDSRFRMIRQSNHGPGFARNRGIHDSTGRFVAFLDADDEWMPSFLEVAMRYFDLLGPEISAVTLGYSEGSPDASSQHMWEGRGLRPGIQSIRPDTPSTAFVSMVAFMTPCTTVVRRSVVRLRGGFYEKRCCRYGEDAFLWLKVLLNDKVFFDFKPCVTIHRDASELSRRTRFPRPLEPFLEHRGLIEAECPLALRGILREFLAIRAFKTACIWSSSGRWREAAALRKAFRTRGDYRLPYYWTSILCGTPIGGLLARVWWRFALNR